MARSWYEKAKELGSPEDPTQEQVSAVKHRMELEQLEPPRQTDAAALDKLAFELPCNAVSLIEVVRVPPAGSREGNQ